MAAIASPTPVPVPAAPAGVALGFIAAGGGGR
jgi:hypothetical protein